MNSKVLLIVVVLWSGAFSVYEYKHLDGSGIHEAILVLQLLCCVVNCILLRRLFRYTLHGNYGDLPY